jgi:hypothetical protein
MLAKLRTCRPSHATVVAYLALFTALGGSAYAVATITGKDIKNRSITKIDIKKNNLTGREILERQLGRVPRARRARRAGTAGTATSALSAGTATSADVAKNSDALSGQTAGFFEKTSRTSFGRGSLNPSGESGEQVLLSWPEMGIEVTSATNQAACGGAVRFAVRNTGGPDAQLLQKGPGADPTVQTGDKDYVCSEHGDGVDAELTDSSGRMLFVDCAPANGELRCIGVRSEP